MELMEGPLVAYKGERGFGRTSGASHLLERSAHSKAYSSSIVRPYACEPSRTVYFVENVVGKRERLGC